MMLKFLTPENVEWQEFLRAVRHDFYHLPAYARLMEGPDGGRAEAVLATSGDRYFFLPYIVRPLSQISWLGDDGTSMFDIVSPYGYPGPLMSGDAAFFSQAIGEWHGVMRERGAVSGFMRLHPLLNLDLTPLSQHGEIVSHGRTVSINLQLSLEELWRRTSQTHRNEISKARRYGLTASMDDSFQHLPAFIEMYYETMDRAQASKYYYFPTEYFQKLRDCLGPQMSLCVVTDPDGAPLCGALFTECCGIVQYHLSASRTAALSRHPTKLMLDWVRTWAKNRGNQTMHLGGGMGAREDSLFNFKSRFGTDLHPFYTWQILFEREMYQGLEGRRRAHSTEAMDKQFFPIYRS